MSDRCRVTLPIVECLDNANFTAEVEFEDRGTETPIAPSTVDYKVDCLTTGQEVQGWTSVTPGASVAIALASAYSAIQTSSNLFEIKQITVAGDRGLTYECNGQARWTVINRELQA